MVRARSGWYQVEVSLPRSLRRQAASEAVMGFGRTHKKSLLAATNRVGRLSSKSNLWSSITDGK